MKEIGGYFELELMGGNEYHEHALRLNTGRNAFEFILRVRNYKKVYLPYYTCDVILEPITKLNLEYEFYHIKTDFTPVFNFNQMANDAVFLYTNYFGVNAHLVKMICKQCKNVIVDNSQAFYTKPLSGIDTFYSPRKFFGISDGSYLYTDKAISNELEADYSYKRCEHLLGRIDVGAKEFYLEFKDNDTLLKNQPIKRMSKLTQRILASINYTKVGEVRKDNFNFLHNTLQNSNQIIINTDCDTIPMVYPYMITNGLELKKKLIESNIFVATYWPNVIDWCKPESTEYKMTQNLIPLPIDQRYTTNDMDFILKTIQKYV